MRYHGSSRGGIEVDLAAGTSSGGGTGSEERIRRMKEVREAVRRVAGRQAGSSCSLLVLLAAGRCAACPSSACLAGPPGHRPSPPALVQAHGWLMAVGFGLLIPLGIVVARHGKGVRPPLWFHAHRAIQVTGMACVLAAFVMIFVCACCLLMCLFGRPTRAACACSPGLCRVPPSHLVHVAPAPAACTDRCLPHAPPAAPACSAVNDATGTSVSQLTVHRNLGIAAVSLGLAQATALGLRRARPGREAF